MKTPGTHWQAMAGGVGQAGPHSVGSGGRGWVLPLVYLKHKYLSRHGKGKVQLRHIYDVLNSNWTSRKLEENIIQKQICVA